MLQQHAMNDPYKEHHLLNIHTFEMVNDFDDQGDGVQIKKLMGKFHQSRIR